jgi:hypothetical protein
MSLVSNVKTILKDNHIPRHAQLQAIQKRYAELVERGIIQEELPKTFGPGQTVYDDFSNHYIDYSLHCETRRR